MSKIVETPDDTGAEVVEGTVVGGEIAVHAGAQVVIQTSVETLLLTDNPKLPAPLVGAFELMPWYRSLAYRDEYKELDPDRIARKIMMRTFASTSVADVFEQQKPLGLQGIVSNVPGAGTGPIDITDIAVMTSEHKTGVPCFMVFEMMSRATGEVVITTTGAQELQAQILTLVALGVWPIQCEIKRIDAKDRGGRFMFRAYPLA